MKLLITALLIVFNSVSALATDTQPGYLVFSLGRATWGSHVDENYSFKVFLNDEFKAQFKHLPNQHSMGTGFYCGGRKADPAPSWSGPTGFTCWVRRTSDGKLSINMWGKGTEEIKGHRISSQNPSASQYVIFKSWEDIDMVYQLSYQAGMGDGLNVSFKVKYYPATSKKLEEIPLAPIRKTDQGDLIPRELKDNKNVTFGCGFQEG